MLQEGLTFDDVLLVPKYSEVESRSSVDISSELWEGQSFELPIVASPMDTISEEKMVAAMHQAGGLAVIHRYQDIKEQARMVRASSIFSPVAAAISASDDYMERALDLVAAGAQILCLDVAHGDHILVKRALQNLKNKLGDTVHIMAGNVATFEGYLNLVEWGADSIRVGIGGGSICSTRLQTGHGVPNFSALMDIVNNLKLKKRHPSGSSASISDPYAAKTLSSSNSMFGGPAVPEYGESFKKVPIIIDGGIRSAGDIVKSLAAGADFVMVGSLLAGTEEAAGEFFQTKKGMVKSYRGMASREAQMEWRSRSSSPEGISTVVPYRGSVEPILEDLRGAIRSGLSYSGATSIEQLRKNSTFIKQSGASIYEGKTHILSRYG